MAAFMNNIRHDGGALDVRVKVDDDTALITFGSSFTLRLDVENVDKLRYLLHDASIAIACNQNTDMV